MSTIVQVKEYNKKEMAQLYGITKYRFRKRMHAMLKDKAIAEKFGPYDGTFTVRQVKIIFGHMQLPYDMEVEN